MAGIVKKLEDMFAAAAFAEEGEHETAKEIVKASEDKTLVPSYETGRIATEED